MRRCARILAAVALLALPGCARYLQHRADDALEVLDLGVTWSERPGFAAYADLASVAPAGFGYVDGYFAGIGGGQIGATEHYEGSLGLLVWGYEEVGWAEHDKHVPGTLDRQRVGFLGILNGPGDRRLAYAPASVSYLHLGYGGIAASLRHGEMVDFLLGWFGLDIAGDDGSKLGQPLGELDSVFAFRRTEPPPAYTWCPRCAQRVWAPGLADGPGGSSPIAALRRTLGGGGRPDVCRCPLAAERALAAAPPRDSRSPKGTIVPVALAAAPPPGDSRSPKGTVVPVALAAAPPRDDARSRSDPDLTVGAAAGAVVGQAAALAPLAAAQLAPAAAEAELARRCRLYQFLTNGGPQVVSAAATTAGTMIDVAVTAGEITWFVGRTTLRIAGGVARVVGSVARTAGSLMGNRGKRRGTVSVPDAVRSLPRP